MVMGASIVIWACTPIEVSFNHDLLLDSMDIPIKYQKDGKEVTAFADTKTFKIKNSTKLFPSNTIIHPQYYIEGSWWCKNGRIGRCDPPKKFKVDTTEMKEALQDLYATAVYNKTDTDIKSQEDFQKIVTLPTKSSDILFNMSTQLVENDVNGLRDTFHLDQLEDDMYGRIYAELMNNPVAVAVFVLFSVSLLGLFIYGIWTCRRWAEVRHQRHLGPRGKKLSKMNYWWAFASHRRMDINMNKRGIQDVKDVQTGLESKLKRLSARLDSMENIIKMEKSAPPSYPEISISSL